MSSEDGFPVLHFDARQTVFGRPSEVLVMSLLGRPVQSMLNEAVKAERPAHVRKIGRDVIECLRKLHSSGYVHNDIKAQNLLLGHGRTRENDVFLVDFGLVSK